jgi:hypothetical protein
MSEKSKDSELEFLLKNPNIGTYNKCEIIEIFGYNKSTKEYFNIYSLIIFQITNQKNTEKFLTNNLQEFEGLIDLKWGVKKKIVDIRCVKKIFNKLNNDKGFTTNTGNLKSLTNTYVQPKYEINKEIQLNYLLKNNFNNGSYVLEFFDESKHYVDFLFKNPVLLNSFSEKVRKILPLSIANTSDRLGNIIFQLPINNFEVSHDSIVKGSPKKYTGILFEIFPKNNFQIKDLQVRMYEENDNIITRQRLVDIKKFNTEIELDDCFGTHIELLDTKNSILLYKCKMNIVKHFNLSSNIIESQKRVFKINDEISKIPLTSNMDRVIGDIKKHKNYNEWVRDRIYHQELSILKKDKSFIQYFGDEQNKALNDVKELIDKYGRNGVCLWDPYLSAIDIKNTLYFSHHKNASLRAISGLKQESKENAKNTMNEEFESDNKDFLFLNLEVRGNIGSNGCNFHDRFLIFPLESPKAWSLGVSINQLGSSHHILQEVKHSQHILNAFNELWDKLDAKECLIWKSN